MPKERQRQLAMGCTLVALGAALWQPPSRINAAEAAPAPARATGSGPAATSSKKASKFLEKAAVAKKPKTVHRTAASSGRRDGTAEKVSQLKEQLELQQQQISQLLQASAEQKQSLDKALQVIQSLQAVPKPAALARAEGRPAPRTLGEVASLNPMVPALTGTTSGNAVISTASLPSAPAAGQDEAMVQKVDDLSKSVDALTAGIAGFKFSGDLRLRSDNTVRSANSFAGPQQNIRARYRLRFNVDKVITDQFDTHFQLSSGTFINPLTYDSDFTGLTSRGPIFLSEAWADYHPDPHVSLRGGKMAEVFADNAKFLLDDDVRFNGFHEIFKDSEPVNGLGKVTFEARFGQYILSNPNVQVLSAAAQSCSPTAPTITIPALGVPVPVPQATVPPAACGWLRANFTNGQNIRATELFDQGIVITAKPDDKWAHQFTANFEVWRNPNTIQLGSISSGVALVAGPYYGLTLSGPITTGLGSATTTPGGGAYTASHYQVAQLAYRLDYLGLPSSRQKWPVSLEFHGSQNVGTSFYRTAFMGQLTVGETKKLGDVLLRYGYFYKPANSMISQVTDDDLGTNTTVNLRTHYIRFETALNKFVTWQNAVYIQNELAGNDKTRNFFVILPKGTAQQYRIQSQMLFTF